MLSEKKALLRKEILTHLNNISKEHKNWAGKIVAKHIYHWLIEQQFKEGMTINIFLSLKDEIDTEPIIETMRKFKSKIYFPKKSPIVNENFKIIFVPGLAFDRLGNRLGRGLGYYDKMLKPLESVPQRAIFVGLTLDEQIVDEIPVDENDVVMDYICTPKLGMLKAKKKDF